MRGMERKNFSNVVFWTCMIFLLESCTGAIRKSTKNGGDKQADVKAGLKRVQERIQQAMQMRSDESKNISPTLVAVSVAQPIDRIVKACEAGQKHFGESFVDELVSKANNKLIKKKCPEIKWHFVGHIINNQIPKLVGVPNLDVIETVETRKIAAALERSVAKQNNAKVLRVFVQPNTNKPDVSEFVKYVIEQCPHLKFSGLMISVKNSFDSTKEPNPEFIKMIEFKKQVVEKLNLSPADVQLSMGMSEDFESAIALGSDNVRIDTKIFGERKY